MRDKELAGEVLQQIQSAAEKIVDRFQPIREASDFTNCPAGVEKMDAICMVLIVIGESLKNLDKITNGALLQQYPDVDWKKAKGMRDILTHHYADINAENLLYLQRQNSPTPKNNNENNKRPGIMALPPRNRMGNN
ncbi:DUF86 domain-containing protein [Desulfococcus sp.]|uniref:HepT-like ribonuclease domain-containing protein n=1 Tax=Desulfococcus sp. TaxID=2025834 RepID=UPI00359460F2